MKKNEMGVACGMYGGGGEKCIQGFGEGTRGKRHFGRPSSSWKHDIKLYLRGAMEWIDLAQNRDK